MIFPDYDTALVNGQCVTVHGPDSSIYSYGAPPGVYYRYAESGGYENWIKVDPTTDLYRFCEVWRQSYSEALDLQAFLDQMWTND